MKKIKIISVVGARPNFMKIAPLLEQIERYPHIESVLVHTGQHYDYKMSEVFLKDLSLPKPDIYMGINSGSHAEQTAGIMVGFENICRKENPSLVLLVGDVNSTLACSLVAAKLCIPLAHIEAGLRSFDRTMPEEINRIVTDSLSDLLFTTCKDANKNLENEGVPEQKIHFVGNVMIDTLMKFKNRAQVNSEVEVVNKDYALLTLHRPSNVDNRVVFLNIIKALKSVSERIPIIFSVHPRAKKQIEEFGFGEYFKDLGNDLIYPLNLDKTINMIPSLSYIDFLKLMMHAKVIMTDSGGIQEEATILGVKCLTIRKNTERPVTIKVGNNTLVGNNTDRIIEESLKVLDSKDSTVCIPELWDGHAAQRIVNVLLEELERLNRNR